MQSWNKESYLRLKVKRQTYNYTKRINRLKEKLSCWCKDISIEISTKHIHTILIYELKYLKHMFTQTKSCFTDKKWRKAKNKIVFSPVSEQQTRVLDQRSTQELKLLHTRPRARLRRQRNNKKLDIFESNRDVLQQFDYIIFDWKFSPKKNLPKTDA